MGYRRKLTNETEAPGFVGSSFATWLGAQALLGLLLLFATPCSAQELAPRAYWPAPKGTQVAITGYSFSTGDVVTDPSLPIVGVNSNISRAQLGFLQTISLLGRTANLVVEAPYAWGSTEGSLEGEPARRDFSGLGDLVASLSVNLLGAPSMTPADFQELRKKPRPILGASLKLVAPTGTYDADKLVNVGANRWAAKAGVGSIFPLRPKWLLELALGAWFMGTNDDFLGKTRQQDPIYSAQAHLVKRFKPGRWASFDLNYFTGGQDTVDGQVLDDLQRNSDVGVTVLWTFRGRHAVKLGLSTGIVTKSGGNFGNVLLSYQVRIN